ncbi:MAG TPA: SDR family NAD(P)-dependent oxidoreductase [Pseudosphingobacterium sp.]|nr:SDR family NAD(P)-dependent oxidoreductase [Pseudosphingobacterium sp.]
MAKIFITGSSDGLGLLTAKALIAEAHQVVLHAKNAKRKDDTLQKIQGAEAILTADLSSIEETKILAEEVNRSGKFDTVIHNAGIYGDVPGELLFSVNVGAPFILTSLIHKPKRLIYLTSSMHQQGQPKLECLKNDVQQLNYSDCKLLVLMLTKAVARKWNDVYANGVDPGWVPTKMGGSSATDDLQKGFETQVWLATGNDEQANVSGRYFYHQQEKPYNTLVDDAAVQDRFLKLCSEITGVSFPPSQALI